MGVSLFKTGIKQAFVPRKLNVVSPLIEECLRPSVLKENKTVNSQERERIDPDKYL